MRTLGRPDGSTRAGRRAPRPLRAAIAAALGAPLLAGCASSAPLGTIPEPLPESLAWAAEGQFGAFLGVKGEENDSGSLDAMFFDPGVRVTRVVENSPAALAGLRAGDVVLALDGEAVDDPAALDALVARRRGGEQVTLSVRRGDTVYDARIELAQTAGGAEVEARWIVERGRSRASWSSGRGGVVLVAAADDSPFPQAGIPVGSVLTAVEGRPLLSDRQLVRLLSARAPGEQVEVQGLAPDGAPFERTVTLQEQPRRLTRFKLPLLFDYEASVDGARTRIGVLDLWFVQLFGYERNEAERTWVLLELFGWEPLRFSSGVGELAR